MSTTIKDTRLSPILKWAGGKEQELKHIHPYMPTKINNYYEPFIGGGAVYFSLESCKMFINDKSHELILENNKAIFIDNYAYSGMFRYNKSGSFNVPYGGIGYNRIKLSKKVHYLKSKELRTHLASTTIDNLDNDFIFLDPPYDSEFSNYAKK